MLQGFSYATISYSEAPTDKLSVLPLMKKLFLPDQPYFYTCKQTHTLAYIHKPVGVLVLLGHYSRT